MKNVWTVAYRHEYGTDVSVYATEKLAYKGACATLANWLDELDGHADQEHLIELINSGSYKEAVELWSQMICDYDIMEEITVGSSDVITIVGLEKLEYNSDTESAVD